VAAISISGTKAQLEDIPAKAAHVMDVAAFLSQQISAFSSERQPGSRGLIQAFQMES
jgi:hypothetical protein